MAISVHRARKSRTACDRCYELKERCDRASTTASCSRCDRLSLVCSTIRPIRPAGRRRQARTHSTSTRTSGISSTTLESCPQDISLWLDNVPDLPLEERELLTFLLGRPETLDCYVVCPSFQAAEQQSLVVQLLAALPILKDAYLACADSLRQLHLGIETETGSMSSIRHTSSAMNTLRSLPVSNPQDAALCLTLGTALALSVHTSIGVGIADICRHCLSTTSPFVETAASDSLTEPRQGFLVLMEIMDCLVYRRKPTLRIQLRSIDGVDRHLGLCSPLLSYYCDLCAISYSLANTSDKGTLTRLQKQLGGIQASIEAWQPSHLDQLVDQFDSAEIVNLLAHAKVYRLSALLVGHRLRHAFGENDSQANVWSTEIMMELQIAQRIAKRHIRCVTLPFLVAAVEIQDPIARAKSLHNVDKYMDHYTPFLQKATKTFLLRVWQERDFGITSFWFDSIHKPCPVLDAMDAACFA
jgi:hypothetical protein